MKKVYLAKLERFGYVITAVGKTKGEAADAVISSYIESFKSSNEGLHPSKDEVPCTGQNYLDLAKEELYVTPVTLGESIWL